MDKTVLEALEDDDDFKQFFNEDFDAKGHASTVIQGLAISHQLSKLAEGIHLLDKELHSQVVAHHDDLLSQATGVETLEGVLQMMQTRTQSLLAAIERIKNRVNEPYDKIVSRTTQLHRLQETCDLLRRIIRILYLSKKLQSQIQGGAREITKAAQSINELDYLSEGVDLTGIDIIEADRRFVKQAKKQVEAQGQNMLEQGMQTQNQTQVATALQVFHNLGKLSPTVDKVMENCGDSLRESVKSAFNMASITQQHGKGGPGKAAMPAVGNTAAFRATLWTNMEKLMDSIYSACAQAQHLQKVLVKKKDPATHVVFIQHLAEEKGGAVNLMKTFWQDMTAMLSQEFSTAANSNTFLKQAFEGEYPKLLRLYNELWRRLQQNKLDVGVSGGTLVAREEAMGGIPDGEAHDILEEKPEVPFEPEQALKASLTAFEQAYLSRSLSRLFDPINLVFAAGSVNPPTKDEVEGIVNTISSELSVSSVDHHLSITVAKNVSKTVQLFCVKSEQLLSTAGEASQVIGPPTDGQTRNAATVNSLYQLHQSVSRVTDTLEQFPVQAVHAIRSSLEGVVVLMGNAINPLLLSIGDALEAIILTIHNEDFSQSQIPNQSESQCSLYMRELQEFIMRVSQTYLAQFTCDNFILDSAHEIACKSVELFVRHASLVRPLGDGGKMRLAADFAQMELAVAPLTRKVSDLGKSYRILRAFRPLLFQTQDHVSSSPAIGEIIPHSVVLHYLFGRAPPDLKPPHEAANWSLSRYTQWLDDHPAEKDRLLFIKGSLESYVQSVKNRGDTEFAAIYPVMLDLLQKGLAVHS